MIAGVRGSVGGLMAEVVEDHIRTHLVDPRGIRARLTPTRRIS